MRRYLYRILYYFLRSLIYGKRAVIWIFSGMEFLLSKSSIVFRNTVGWRVYKIWFCLQKVFGRIRLPWDNRIIEFLGKRSTLQLILFIVVILIMVPHSKLYSRDMTKVAGQNTLLYELVGPGEQDFMLEEISVDFSTLAIKETETWKQGAVSAQPGMNTNSPTAQQSSEITSLSAGGTALTKPLILPGASLPNVNTQTGRTEIVYYQVKVGDTIGEIAENYGISVVTILWANNLSARSYIRPGDQLKILPISGLAHKVKKGDTLAKIAKTYGTGVEKIVKFNKLKEDGLDIVIGEELIIPEGVMPQPKYTYTPTTRRYTQLSNISAPPPSASAPAGSGYLWPTNVRRITQYYGWRHTGLDIAGPSGSPLYASRTGEVIGSQCGWNGGYGCYIIIDHGDGVQTLYAHASKLYVKTGESVVQGQTIAVMGSTGRSTGPHIHFEVRINGRRANPLQYIR